MTPIILAYQDPMSQLVMILIGGKMVLCVFAFFWGIGNAIAGPPPKPNRRRTR